MKIKGGWVALEWGYVCDQSHGIERAWEKVSNEAEYGVNFHEFINTAEGLSKYADEWWDNLTEDRQRELLNEQVYRFQENISRVNEFLEKMNKKEVV